MTETLKIKTSPTEIFKEYEQANAFKDSIGALGIFEQTKMNERFYVGDQWYGAQCGNARPLVRNNIIKRIGDYKIATVGAAPIAVNYSADGVPNTADIKSEAAELRAQMMNGEATLPSGAPDAIEVSVITEAMSNYFKVSSERVKFDIKAEQALRNAYISGTAVAYTYWDKEIKTGLYADEGRTTPINGDIAFEILDVENVSFGDPNSEDVQRQPYILLAQRMDVEAVRREAKKNGLSVDDIVPDGATHYNSGDRGEAEPNDSRRVTVITKLYKEWSKDAKTYTVMAVKVTEKAIVREPWVTGLSLYPIAVFHWERRRSSAYGDSEITYLIPNQIALNRMYVSEIWSGLNHGMPKMLVNGNIIDEKITNDPGQIIKVHPDNENPANSAIQYVSPPPWATQYLNAINDLANNTLTSAGANDAALGNIKPDNAAAIIQAREASLQPMQIFQNRYYAFIEDIARIWAEFWIRKYGNRLLKVETRNGTEYIPFKADRYEDLVLTARVDVGASTLWSEAVVISTLDSLFGAQAINLVQYLERLPKGLIPKVGELIDDIKQENEAQTENQQNTDDKLRKFAEMYPDEYSALMQLPPEQQEAMIRQLVGGAAV